MTGSRLLRTLIATLAVLALIAGLVVSLPASPAQAKGKGSRSDPYWHGTKVYTDDFDVTLGKTIKNWGGLDYDWTPNNEVPVAVPVTIKYWGGGSAAPRVWLDIELVGSNGRVYTSSCGDFADDWMDIDGLEYQAAAKATVCVSADPDALGSGAKWRIKQWLGSRSWQYVRLVNPAKPVFKEQPSTRGGYVDSTLTLSAKVSGAKELQWQTYTKKKWRNVAGATRSSLRVKLTPAMNNRPFRLVATNAQGSKVSDTAQVVVWLEPGFDYLPPSRTVRIDTTTTLKVAVYGATKPQWQQKVNGKWRDIKGATKSSLRVKVTKANSGRMYRLKASNRYRTSYSSAIKVTARYYTPTFPTQPKSTTVTADKTATFTAKTNEASSFRWQYKSGSTWRDIAGATKTTYTVTATPAVQGRQYRLKASNKYRTTYSKTATLTVSVPVPVPKFSTQPKSQRGLVDRTVTLTAKATNTVRWQWQQRASTAAPWVDIAGATGASYTVSATTARHGNQYRVIAHARYASTASTSATLTVLERPVFTKWPSSIDDAQFGNSIDRFGGKDAVATHATGYGWETYLNGKWAASGSSDWGSWDPKEISDLYAGTIRIRAVAFNDAGRVASPEFTVTVYGGVNRPLPAGRRTTVDGQYSGVTVTTNPDAEADRTARALAAGLTAPEPGSTTLVEATVRGGQDLYLKLRTRDGREFEGWNSSVECGESVSLTNGEIACVAVPLGTDLTGATWMTSTRWRDFHIALQ